MATEVEGGGKASRRAWRWQRGGDGGCCGLSCRGGRGTAMARKNSSARVRERGRGRACRRRWRAEARGAGRGGEESVGEVAPIPARAPTSLLAPSRLSRRRPPSPLRDEEGAALPARPSDSAPVCRRRRAPGARAGADPCRALGGLGPATTAIEQGLQWLPKKQPPGVSVGGAPCLALARIGPATGHGRRWSRASLCQEPAESAPAAAPAKALVAGCSPSSVAPESPPRSQEDGRTGANGRRRRQIHVPAPLPAPARGCPGGRSSRIRASGPLPASSRPSPIAGPPRRRLLADRSWLARRYVYRHELGEIRGTWTATGMIKRMLQILTRCHRAPYWSVMLSALL